MTNYKLRPIRSRAEPRGGHAQGLPSRTRSHRQSRLGYPKLLGTEGSLGRGFLYSVPALIVTSPPSLLRGCNPTIVPLVPIVPACTKSEKPKALRRFLTNIEAGVHGPLLRGGTASKEFEKPQDTTTASHQIQADARMQPHKNIPCKGGRPVSVLAMPAETWTISITVVLDVKSISSFSTTYRGDVKRPRRTGSSLHVVSKSYYYILCIEVELLQGVELPQVIS